MKNRCGARFRNLDVTPFLGINQLNRLQLPVVFGFRIIIWMQNYCRFSTPAILKFEYFNPSITSETN